MMKPRPHQKAAIRAVVAGLKKTNRGQLIMACRTGKTPTSIWVAQKMKARRILVLVPNLGLAAQMIREWKTFATGQLSVLAVCSDGTVHSQCDDTVADVEHEAHVTTDAAEIRAFLSTPRKGITLVVGTYHSSERIEQAQRGRKCPAFDMAIADEAHHCACDGDSFYGTILDGKRIKAKKRLFMTATPKIYKASAHKRAKSDGYELSSMDDRKTFGPVLHTLTFGKARQLGLICDFQLIVLPVKENDVLEMLTGPKRNHELEMTASQVALIKACKKYGIHKVLAFFSNTSKARRFAESVPGVRQAMSKQFVPAGEMREWVVTGEMPASARKEIVETFGSLNGDSVCFLSNCRVFGEGTTMPDLDCAALMDPKQSTIEIIQAISRAMGRSSRNPGKVARFFVPIFFKEGESEEEALARPQFRPLTNVLSALRSVDERVDAYVDAVRKAERGEREKPEKPEWLEVPVDVKGMERAIEAAISECRTRDPDEKKRILIDMCISGKPMPHFRSHLGISHRGFFRNDRPSYDPSYVSRISEINPSWIPGWAPKMDEKDVVSAMISYKKEHGRFPTGRTPSFAEELGRSWQAVNLCGSNGYGGLRKGATISNILFKYGLKANRKISTATIKRETSLFLKKNGFCPTSASGSQWNYYDRFLRNRGSSLSKMKRSMFSLVPRKNTNFGKG